MAVELGNIDVPSVTSNIMPWVMGVFALIVLILVGALVWWYLRYNINVVIFEKVGNTARITKDKGRIFKDKNGVYKFDLLKKKIITMPPSYKSFYPEKTKKTLFLYEGEPNSFTPIHLTTEKDSLVFAPLEQDVQFWTHVALRESVEKYANKGWWEQYGSYVVFFGGLTLTFILVLVSLKYVSDISQVAATVGDRLAEAADKYFHSISGQRPPG